AAPPDETGQPERLDVIWRRAVALRRLEADAHLGADGRLALLEAHVTQDDLAVADLADVRRQKRAERPGLFQIERGGDPGEAPAAGFKAAQVHQRRRGAQVRFLSRG